MTVSTAVQRRLPGRWSAWRASFARRGTLGSESGSASLELAFFVAFFALPLLLGTGQIGILVYDSIEIVNAANAGATYAMQSSTLASNTPGIVTAAQTEATDFGTALTVTSYTYYACATAMAGTQYTGSNAQANAQAACTGASNHAMQFVQVNTSVAVTSKIQCPGLPKAYTLVGSSVMEVEQ